MELSIQLAIIFVGKQFLFSISEYFLSYFWRLLNWIKIRGWNFYIIISILTFEVKFPVQTKDVSKEMPQYVKDFQLAEWGHQGLFYEYLEMIIQVGCCQI